MNKQMIELLLSLGGVQRSKLLRQINEAMIECIEGDQPSMERAKFWMLFGDEITLHKS